jgi:putative Holliday junction resolvase
MKRFLGIDFGKVRLGLAISDELGFMSHPLETLRMRDANEVTKRIGEIVREKDVQRVVVGLPRNMDGSHGRSAEGAIAFAAKLRAHLSCDVVTWDERLTTVSANRALRETGRSTREARGYVDQVAAQMILQGYLDRLQAIAASEKASGDVEPD